MTSIAALINTYDYLNNIPYELITKVTLSDIREYDNETQDYILDMVIKHYRKAGFPYFKFTDTEIWNIFYSLKSSNLDIDEDGYIPMTEVTASTVASSFNPHMWDVPCRNVKSPMEIFLTDNLLKRVIKKIVNKPHVFDGGGTLSDTNIRIGLRSLAGGQGVSNFKPSVAKYIYDTYAPKNGKVLDPCHGYAGRLLGALASHISEYTGVDPCFKTWRGAVTLNGKIKKLTKERNEHLLVKEVTIPTAKLIRSPFEDTDLPSNYYDLAFTSPPYFNLEKYSEEDDQSFKRYPEYKLWEKNFLAILIEKAYLALKPGGYFAINVGGGELSSYVPESMEESVLRLCKQVFGDIHVIRQMKLARLFGTVKENGDRFKLEPIFIYRKKQIIKRK
jgi:SAM-dependent methyltransferase